MLKSTIRDQSSVAFAYLLYSQNSLSAWFVVSNVNNAYGMKWKPVGAGRVSFE